MKKNRKIRQDSPMEQLSKQYLENPFYDENGHTKNKPPASGGITMNYCYKCDIPYQGSMDIMCSLCGSPIGKNILTVKQLQQRSIKAKEQGYLLIGKADVRWWQD